MPVPLVICALQLALHTLFNHQLTNTVFSGCCSRIWIIILVFATLNVQFAATFAPLEQSDPYSLKPKSERKLVK
jgi:hypothetical protein